MPVAAFSLVSQGQRRRPPCPLLAGAPGTKEEGPELAAVCLFSCLCCFICISVLLSLPETPAPRPMKVDIDAFLRASVFKCLLVQVMAVLPLEQEPVFDP